MLVVLVYSFGYVRELVMNIPELEHGCNSWVVIRRGNGQVLFETWNRELVGAVNQDIYEVMTTYSHLVRLNAQIKLDNQPTTN